MTLVRRSTPPCGEEPRGVDGHERTVERRASSRRQSGRCSGCVPEHRVTTPEGARLVESKAIGEPSLALSRTSDGNNARSANEQIRVQAERTGEAEGGLIRLDGREAGNTDVTPETIRDWVGDPIPSPWTSRVAQ